MNKLTRKKKTRKKKTRLEIYALSVFLLSYFVVKNYALNIKSILIVYPAIVLIIYGVYRWYQNLIAKEYRGRNFAYIDKMDGKDFEKLLKAHFETLGYKVKLTPDSNDYGADLVIKKNGQVTVVQAKRYKGKVGVSAVQEIVASKKVYNATKCIVATNSYFTPQAVKLAKANKVDLWDRDILKHTFKIKN